MAFSVNTNSGAFLALQNLNNTSNELRTLQNQVNTGEKVASAKDNAAVFSIAQNLRSDVSGLSAVSSSLDRALSTIDVAIAAGEAVSDLMIEMKEKAVAAKDTGLDSASRTSLNDDFQQLNAQINSIVSTAEFNGTNAVGGDSPSSISAITDDKGSTSNTISISAQDFSFGGSIVTLGTNESIAAASTAGSAVTKLESSIDNVNTALSKLGAGAKRLELQKEFTGKLSDAIEVGVGNLVDADLAKTSANLQSLQVKQQLGLQALSIANQAPSTVLGLFR